MEEKNKISVILPTYNEKGCILKLVEAIHKELKECDHEIIVVDDNSPDGTFGLVSDLRCPYIKAVLRKEKPGLANSIRRGLEEAKGDIFIVMDSDFNHQPKYLPFMIKMIDCYDCVTASRFLYGGRMNNKVRHILSWVFNIFIRLSTGGQITDNLYGFFAIKRNIIEEYDYDHIFRGYGDYFVRLMFCLQRNNVNILQFPAENGDRMDGKGNKAFLKTFFQYTAATLRISLKDRFKKNVQKD